MLFLLTTASAQESRVVVTLGGGLVVSPQSEAAAPVGIAAVLGDCLEERAPKKFSVVDRSMAGETLATAGPKSADITGLAPAWVVVTLGARELADPAVDPAKLATDLGALAVGLGASPDRKVLLVGALSAQLVAAPTEAEQPALDARVASLNAALAALDLPGVLRLDPTARGRKAQKEPMVEGPKLSAAGQAKVAAAICELVLSTP
jgi:hypothetical protein